MKTTTLENARYARRVQVRAVRMAERRGEPRKAMQILWTLITLDARKAVKRSRPR